MLSSRDKVQSGQQWEPRSASQHNAWTDAAQFIAQLKIGIPNQSKQAIEYTPIFIEAASTIAPATVVGFGDPNLLVSDNEEALQRVVFDYATPAEGRWAVAQKGIGTGEFEECVLTGIAWAQVNVTDASHTHAEIDSGNLESAESGYAKILYKPAGTGTDWCCLYLGCCAGGSSSGGGSGSEDNTCLCSFIQWALDSVSMSTVEREALEAIRDTCCPVEGELVACVNAASGFVTSPMLVDIDGVSFTTGTTAFDDRAEFAVNTRHQIPMTGCSGAVAYDVTYESGFGPVTETVTLTLEKRSGDWRLTISESVTLNSGITDITTPGDDATAEYSITDSGATSSNVDLTGISGTIAPPD